MCRLNISAKKVNLQRGSSFIKSHDWFRYKNPKRNLQKYNDDNVLYTFVILKQKSYLKIILFCKDHNHYVITIPKIFQSVLNQYTDKIEEIPENILKYQFWNNSFQQTFDQSKLDKSYTITTKWAYNNHLCMPLLFVIIEEKI